MSQYRYTVAGYRDFPIDMLRYDKAYPASEESSGIIERSFMPGSTEHKVVILKSKSKPTVARWESFGYSVHELEKLTIEGSM